MEQPVTDKRYLNDSYTVSFEAGLVSCVAREDGIWEVVLDASYFYPESGGQPADTGALGDARVIGVHESGESTIVHEVDAPLAVERVTGTVDWRTRFDHMQQHSGQHILSRAFIEVCDAETVSFHMGGDSCTIDLDVADVAAESIAAAELLANGVIQENRPVTVTTRSPAEVDKSAIRKDLPRGVDAIRLVEVQGFDTCPCCGTHVRHTGELGLIKVLKSEKTKGRVRIHFKTGMRAYEDYRVKHDLVSVLSTRFTTAVENVPDAVEKLAAENRSFKKSIKKLNNRIMAADKRRLLAAAESSGNKKIITAVLEDVEPAYLKALSSAFKNERAVLVFLASKDGTAVCNASTDIAIDLAALIIDAAQRLGGSGGGSGVFANVSLPPGVDIDQFLKEVSEHAKSSI